VQWFRSYSVHKLFALSRNGKESKNPVLWPWPWNSVGRERSRYMCMQNFMQQFMSYCGHGEKTPTKTILSSLPRMVTTVQNQQLCCSRGNPVPTQLTLNSATENTNHKDQIHTSNLYCRNIQYLAGTIFKPKQNIKTESMMFTEVVLHVYHLKQKKTRVSTMILKQTKLLAVLFHQSTEKLTNDDDTTGCQCKLVESITTHLIILNSHK